DKTKELIRSEKNRLTLLWQKHEAGMSITLQPAAEQPEMVMVYPTQKVLLDCLHKTPHGVFRMNPEIPDTVQTSNNLATLKVAQGSIFIGTLQRSSVATDLTQISKDVADSFVPLGGQIEHFGAYPGWQLTTDSPLLSVASECAPRVYPRPAHVYVVHGGLECGLFKTVFPQLDQIAIGPEILGAHSPDERVNIASVGRFWDFLQEILKSIPS
ncbi:MAG TPA: cytosol nonspecific dipeptidase, partial [bacterium]|nr:cytosol nonspecific dipeptidase [bacterium]